MDALIDLITYGRNSMVALLDGLTAEQVNRVPQGFNNNLIWNMGHVIAVQQVFCYLRSGNEPAVDATFIETYQRGTVPAMPLSQNEIDVVKNLALSTVAQLKRDLGEDMFTRYEAFTVTAQNLPVQSMRDALQFVIFHEGQHLGYAQALKRAVLAA